MKHGGCSCISKYECCPEKCKPLSDSDWKLCKNPKKYGIGKYYAYGTDDCCDCPTIMCLPCKEFILGKPPPEIGKCEWKLIKDCPITPESCSILAHAQLYL